ncbi:MAG: hypothetical protein MJA31_03395 [Clostridia bacterium]|nr:hypothetical protein [Clostridia bacterium]
MKKRFIFAAALSVIAIFLFFTANISFYSVESAVQNVYYSYVSRDMKSLNTAHFTIKYEDIEEAELVASIAEKYYKSLSDMYHYTSEKRIPIIIHSNKEAMSQSVFLKSDKVPMGVYTGKTIQILSPKVWINETENLAEIFEKQGPIIHEMSHYMVDDITKGNHSQWFFEGIALYTEYLYTGYVIGDHQQFDDLYTVDELEENFSELDTIKAYYSSFMLIKDTIEENNLEYLNYMLECLEEGNNKGADFIFK